MAAERGIKINGHALRAIREAKDLSVTECAKRAKVSQGAWSNWEAQRKTVSYENLFGVLAALGGVDIRAIVWEPDERVGVKAA